MHQTVQNLYNIQNKINSKINEYNYKDYIPKIIAVSKTFKLNHISPLIESGHIHFGENKVQEAVEKWSEIKSVNDKIQLHMLGKLQTNKVKLALKIFNYIHSVDNIKLATKISDEQKKYNNKPKIFIQINIGDEQQKSGIDKKEFPNFYESCKNLDLDIIGTMCIPPENLDSEIYFSEIQKLNNELQLNELSMGMSSDYLNAIKYKSTFLRIGTSIFGKRT